MGAVTLSTSQIEERATAPPYAKPRAGFLLERFILGCDVLAAKLGRARQNPAHLDLGIKGEDAAFFYLRRMGFVVVARRWHSYRHPGDLDLVAWEGETLCFVEVKARSSHAVAEAEAAVDSDKRRILRRLARHYMRYLPVETANARFDVLTVYFEAGKAAEFVLFRAAFGWSEHRERER